MVQELIIAEALSWIGTPYIHQASLKHKGCDCVGLLIGVWREVYGSLPADFKLPTYTPNWAEESKTNLMTDIAQEYLETVDVDKYSVGDIVMYRMLKSAPTKHCGIIVSPTEIVHAYSKYGVVKTPFIQNKTIKLTHVFKFPEKRN